MQLKLSTQRGVVLAYRWPSAYAYYQAKQIINAGGVAFSWDNNGNLLNDGTIVYSYTQANRLKTLVQAGNNYTFTYNGLGDRLKQVVNTAPTTYTLDLNAGLTQVLADGSNTYLYGNGRIAQAAGTSSSYFLPDALGSVRQLATSGGAVSLAERYEPYGALLTSAGSGSSVYGFTGEQTDGNGLVFLRARNYAPGQGRFITRDEWGGDYQRPQSMDRWSYVEDGPINRNDPTGHGLCLPLVGIEFFDLPANAPLTVGQAIDMCRLFFSKEFLPSLPFTGGNGPDFCYDERNRAWTTPETTGELGFDWLCGWGPKHVYLEGTNALTQEFAKSYIVDQVRKAFYARGNLTWDDQDREVRFGVTAFAASWLDLKFSLGHGDVFPVSEFVGSFDRQVFELPFDRIGFQLDNRTDRESGTHFAERFYPPYQGSLEQLVDTKTLSRDEPLVMALKTYPVISILARKKREELTGTEGGGTMRQTFVWSERNLKCIVPELRWPDYIPLLDIRIWSDFRNYSQQTDEGL